MNDQEKIEFKKHLLKSIDRITLAVELLKNAQDELLLAMQHSDEVGDIQSAN